MSKKWNGMFIDEGAASTPASLTRALDDVNFIRLALVIGEGKLETFPAGKDGDPLLCVLARALSNGWQAFADYDAIQIGHEYPLPPNFSVELALEKLRQRFPDTELLVFEKEFFNISAGKFNFLDALDPASEYIGGFSFMPNNELYNLMQDFDAELLPDLLLKED